MGQDNTEFAEKYIAELEEVACNACGSPPATGRCELIAQERGPRSPQRNMLTACGRA